MHQKCPRCNLNNNKNAKSCVRCLYVLREVSTKNVVKTRRKLTLKSFIKRAVVCIIVCILAIAGFYFSLIYSSDSLSFKQKVEVEKAIEVLEAKGFVYESFILNNLTSFRASDNWLNASIPKENAYAATNYPFEIMTIYADFFTYPRDDVERAAILLHEAKHLQGYDEPVAYEFVWKNKKQLGWTKDKYKYSVVWKEIRKQTREYAPHLFTCDFNEYNDCTE